MPLGIERIAASMRNRIFPGSSPGFFVPMLLTRGLPPFVTLPTVFLTVHSSPLESATASPPKPAATRLSPAASGDGPLASPSPPKFRCQSRRESRSARSSPPSPQDHSHATAYRYCTPPPCRTAQ